MKRKYRNKTDISVFWDSIGENQLTTFILGHLSIESVLVQLIERRLENQSKFDAYSLNFPQKVDLCQAFSLIGNDLADYLKILNQYRNKYAHRLMFKLTFDEVYKLVEIASKCGIEFTDDIDKNEYFARQYYKTEELLHTVLSNTFFELAIILDDIGGEFLLG